MNAVFFGLAIGTIFNLSWANIFIPRDVPASIRDHSKLKVIAFGKDFYPKQIKALPSCTEVIRFSRGIPDGFIRGKVIFKNEPLVFPGDPYPKVFDLKFWSFCSIPDRHLNSASIRCIFHGIADQAFHDFGQDFRWDQNGWSGFGSDRQFAGTVAKTRA
jgi:hypothetical protein